ncbi:phage portal protein (plasmid) [Pusillimonas sp. T7-7]|uniref:phage portal protein n=1 Tax=Pusillimonas sp. (strain T7-7) TaxID=1007105 RepID=UPI0002084BC7|nr:phage portal protein [Pusillimonas sp. T7-7]AEC22294.1 phage portal protein [Pusillimonas sp. T7-7]
MLKTLFGKRDPSPERTEPTIGNVVEGETVISSDSIKMFELFGDPTTSAGAVVNDKTAMRVSAVYASVNLIAGSIAQLPLPVYERVGETRVRADHDYWWILNEQFSQAWPSAAGWEFLIGQMLLRGDGIAYITRNRAGYMTGLIPWYRSKVDIFVQDRTSPRDPKRLGYRFWDDEKGYFAVDQDDVLHIPGFGFNGECSMSVIQWGARNGIGIAIQGDDHAGRFFSEGGKPEVAIRAPAEMTLDQQEDFRAAWVAKYGGNSGNRKIPLILTEGLDVKELTMSAVDQQLLESRQWQVIDIARAFGVPPHMIGETTKSTSWGSGIEQMGIGFVKYTLGPHLKRCKDELNRKLFRTARYFVEHNVDGLMAGDSKAQGEYFGKALGGPGAQGWMTINEVRRLKNLPPIEGGDSIYRPTEEAKGNDDEDSEADAISA